MLINSLAGRCTELDWRDLDHRMNHGDRKWRRRRRRQAHVMSYNNNPPVVFSWGDGSWAHQKPWAPMPQQRLVEKAAREHIVFLMNERNTSRMTHLSAAGYENHVVAQAIVDSPVTTV
jgi:hypothetical protein